MRKSCKSLIINALIAIVAGGLLPSQAHSAKTLMWLMDQYQGNIDSIRSVTKVYIPHYGDTGVAKQGFYYGKADLSLARTTAYAPGIPVNTTYDTTGLPDSLKMPKTLERAWWILPQFETGNFKGGMVNVNILAQTANHSLRPGPPPSVQIDTSKLSGQTGQLNQSSATVPGFIDKCLTDVKGDTVWLFSRQSLTTAIPAGYTGETNMRCSDHNPFFDTVGTVHVLNPWPGKTVWAQLGTTWVPLYQEAGRQGWVTATLYNDPRAPQPFTIRLANGDPRKDAAVQYMDVGGVGPTASGVPFDFNAAPGKKGEVWILPPVATGSKPTFQTTAPAVTLTLYIKKPTWAATSLRVLWQGNESKFTPTAAKFCNWFVISFYKGAVPSKILLTTPVGDTVYGATGKAPVGTTQWIDISAQVALGGTSSMNTDNLPAFSPGQPPASEDVCDTKVLAFSTYDYSMMLKDEDPAYFYAPFAETRSGVFLPGTTTTTDNCPTAGGGAMKGLVNKTLNANGRPVWSGKVECDIGEPAHGPQWWFDSLWRKPDGSMSRTAVPGTPQINAFACVRLPLKLDAAGQYYTFSDQAFFPLNGTVTPAPYNPGSNATNYHFAMHAKAAFEYVPGLKFEFSGDDDVWIFIDKKLALDIGGQHGAMSGTIDLDALGLVEGKSYQFDMFYSERHQVGSTISIKTTMNLVPTIDVAFDTTGSAGTKQVLESWVTETTADASKCPEEGATTTSAKRRGSPSYMLIFPDGTQASLDSISILNLLPGIPGRLGGSISQNGSRFEIDTLAIQNSGKLAQTGLYQIRADLGTESRLYSFSNVSKTVDVVGTLFDANGDGAADSVVLKVANGAPGFKNAQEALIRWADRAGLADSVRVLSAALVVLPGDSILTANLRLPSRTSCPPAGCKTKAGFVVTVTSGAPLENPIVELADGMAPVADSAWLVYDTTGSAKDTLYVIASEELVSAIGATLPAGNAVFVQAGSSTAPRPIAGTAILDGTPLLKLPLDPAANPIQPGDSVRLGGFSGDLLKNLPGTLSKWVPLKAEPFAKSWMLDMNGDGYPDSIGVETKGSLASAVSAKVHWKTGSGLDTSFVVATPGGIFGGIKLPIGVLRDGTSCVGCVLEVTTGTDTKRFALLDSVPPVAITASLVFGLEVSDADTVMIQASEGLAKLASGIFALLGKDSASATPTSLIATNSNPSISGNVLKLAVPSGAIANDIAWVRLGTAISDGRKLVGESSRWVKLSLKPSGRAFLFDANGDGAADSMSVYVRGGVQATQALLTWKTAAGAATTRTWPMTPAAGPFSVVAADLSKAFDRGATSCAGCTVAFLDAQGNKLVEWPLIDSVAPMALVGHYSFGTTQDTLKVTFSEDLKSIAANQPWLEWGKTAVGGSIQHSSVDLKGNVATFLIASSNGAVEGWDSLRLAAGSKAGSVSDAGGKTVGATSPWADIVYGIAPFQAYLLDPDGAGQGTAIRVVLTRKVPRAAVTAITSFQFSWTNAAATGTDSRTAKVSEFSWDGVSSWTGNLSSPFALGQTGCTGACTATALAVDASTRATALLDSIPPSAIKARYRYSSAEVAQDTLELELSEPWEGEHPGNVVDPFAVIGKVGDSLDVRNFLSWQMVGNTTLRVIVPASFEKNLDFGDSARLAYLPQGSRVWDAAKNEVGVRSRWVPIDFGLRPPNLEVEPYRQILTNAGANRWDLPPVTHPQTEMVLVNPKDNSLTKIGPDGVVAGAPINDIDRTLGVEIRINRPLEGVLIVYDNMGTAVVSVDLTPMKSLWEGQEDRERVIRIAWNGTGPDHKFAASGVYLFRAVVKYEDKEGNKDFRNIVWKLGFHRDTK